MLFYCIHTCLPFPQVSLKKTAPIWCSQLCEDLLYSFSDQTRRFCPWMPSLNKRISVKQKQTHTQNNYRALLLKALCSQILSRLLSSSCYLQHIFLVAMRSSVWSNALLSRAEDMTIQMLELGEPQSSQQLASHIIPNSRCLSTIWQTLTGSIRVE